MWPRDPDRPARLVGVARVGYRCWQLTTTPAGLAAETAELLAAGHFPSHSEAVEAYLSCMPEPGSWRVLLTASAAAHAGASAISKRCWWVAWALCAEPLVDDDGELEVRYTTPGQAYDDAAARGWEPVGDQLVCPTCHTGLRLGELADVTHPDRDQPELGGWPARPAPAGEPGPGQLPFFPAAPRPGSSEGGAR